MRGHEQPYSESEAREAWLFVNKYGPSNSWTAFGGTAARMIGRLLKERERLLAVIAERQNKDTPYWLNPHD